MAGKFRLINISEQFNSPAALTSRKPKTGAPWNTMMDDLSGKLPRESTNHWGIPFTFGPEDVNKPGLILLAGEGAESEVGLNCKATHVCIAHFCNVTSEFADNAGGGEVLGAYSLLYADGEECAVPIRRRFETNPFSGPWGGNAFAAQPSAMPEMWDYNAAPAWAWGQLQTGVTYKGGSPVSFWIYALQNPRPDAKIASIVMRSTQDEPMAVLGITAYTGVGHPLRHVARKLYKLSVPASEKVTTSALTAEIDLGAITRLYAAPAPMDDEWLKSPDRGLGSEPSPESPTKDFLLEISAAEGATLNVKAGKAKKRAIDFGEAFNEGASASADKKAKLKILNPKSTWVHFSVTDESTGKGTPTRLQMLGPDGQYIPPYGHHAIVNDRWFEDYAGDLQLGGSSYAYVPDRFQAEMPVGEVYVELSKGFEYQPLRKKITIRPGQREVDLKIKRWADWRSKGWITADTHVHFISPETAWLEGQGEGVNLINLLASQWGHLYTNVGDISGDVSGSSRDDTIVWVGTENRNHLLGHMSMLGAHGDPVFPMCAGGPSEAHIGDPDSVLLTEWAEACKERDGVTIRPHFPFPVCEEPLYFMRDLLDGAELRRFANPDSGSLDEFTFREWYKYLNCGYRAAAVGGTDKMSAGMPVGGVRTYAQLDPNEEFSFESWGEAVRSGRTFTTSGPLIEMCVDGQPVGGEIKMKKAGATLEIHAEATSMWPMHRLEIIVNGEIVAASTRSKGTKKLSLKDNVKVTGSCWIAARCGSNMSVNHCWPIHLGAHTSPVYVICDGSDIFSPSDASYMLTLIDGGLTYLDTLSVRYDEKRHREMKAIFEESKRELEGRMDEHGHSPGHGHSHGPGGHGH